MYTNIYVYMAYMLWHNIYIYMTFMLRHTKLIYIYIYIICIYVHLYIYISEHKQNAHNDGNKAQPLKWLLKMAFPRHKEVHWLQHRCYMGEHKSVLCH